MDVLVYNLADGSRRRLSNKRQPDFSRGGILMVNGDGGGVNDVVRITQNGEEGVTAHPEDAYAQWSSQARALSMRQPIKGTASHASTGSATPVAALIHSPWLTAGVNSLA